MEEKYEALLPYLQDLEKVHRDSQRALLKHMTGMEHPQCIRCFRLMVARRRWYELPLELRERLRAFLTRSGAQGYCNVCHKGAIKDGTIAKARGRGQLPDTELERLRKMVGIA